MKQKRDEDEETELDNLQLRLFLKPFMIPPTYNNKNEYADTFQGLNLLERYIESLKVRSYFKGTFHFDPNE